jgi:hypothetical protein
MNTSKVEGKRIKVRDLQKGQSVRVWRDYKDEPDTFFDAVVMFPAAPGMPAMVSKRGLVPTMNERGFEGTKVEGDVMLKLYHNDRVVELI